MIAQISGIVVDANFTEIIVDVNGVGYLIFIPMSTYDKLPETGKKVTLMTFLNVREDALDLYGFATKPEKELFALLRTVSGIGPKVALNILSSMSVENFCNAVANGDVKIITTLKGLGKKTAERLVLELKNKIAAISPTSTFQQSVSPEGKVAKAAEEATLALVQLGFKYDQVAQTVHAIAKELPEKECSTENLMKRAMASISG
jgi:Holliday junction DNA helicase RuvA